MLGKTPKLCNKVLGSSIRSLASGRLSTRVAAAFVERTVQIWQLRQCQKLAQFQTVYDFGGPTGRLAMAPSGDRCAAAAWTAGRRGGVACYEVPSGNLLWHVPELKQTQYVEFSPDGKCIWCMPETGPTRRLDASTGKVLDALRGSPRVFADPHSSRLLLEYRDKKRDYVLAQDPDYHIQRSGGCIIGAAFSPEALCISEFGVVRCIDLSLRVEKWRYSLQNDWVVQSVWHRGLDDRFYGVLDENRRGAFRGLVRFDEHGTCERLCEFSPSCAEAFCADLDCVVTSSGELIRLADGVEIGRLAFPQSEYVGIEDFEAWLEAHFDKPRRARADGGSAPNSHERDPTLSRSGTRPAPGRPPGF